ncbi:hypothetical protein C7T35_36335 [Variovorax sp. WS11]|uniref:adenylate/guanylate cyclase domain-containing protein n=1 Tax=Variovorax sp. WS11 TaxID=1105204 RepID=UPI000D0C9940|nr:adenylate/guanylate cyclase domain-containing protein [Variovorax sp. WS11]NDZ13327.1 hypothetical protein [Variovorax sp. WS11]PSL79652.1 hypothetical protein C7T35_36335 [Variovorax sp. WS11]
MLIAAPGATLGLPHHPTVVLVADLVESVSLMQRDEAGVITQWRAFVAHVSRLLTPDTGGRMVKSLGDGLMLEFNTAPRAAAVALAMHAWMRTACDGLPTPMFLRVGLHSAEVYADEHDIYGKGVNLAARIATLAGPGETVLTAQVRDSLTDGLDGTLEDLGECYLKHLDEPVRVWRLGAAGQQPVVIARRDYATPLKATIAVIPFQSRSNAPDHFAIGELIADGVIGQLSRTADLRVISRLSTTAFRDRPMSAQEVQGHLGADYVLSGSYAVHDSRILLTSELAKAATGDVLDSARVSGDLADLLEKESELCNSVAAGCHKAILDSEVQAALIKPLPTLQSYSLLLSGIVGLHRSSPNGFNDGYRILGTLAERHPTSGETISWLVKWHVLRVIRGLSPNPSEDHQRAAELARRAVENAPQCALAHAMSGLVAGLFQKNLDEAEARYKKALALNANEPLAWLLMGTLLSWQGRGSEAARAAENALALSPFDPLKYYFDSLAAAAMLSAGRHEQAIQLCLRSLRANQCHTATYRVLGIAQVLTGDIVGAHNTIASMMRLEPGFNVTKYLDRYPGQGHPHAQIYADALLRAGAPTGEPKSL